MKFHNILIISLVAIFTLSISALFFNIRWGNNFSQLGQFGDFYGGILGTIITFVGLYFIYNTFQQQKEQLKILKYEADLDILNKLYIDLIQEIESIQYRRINKFEHGVIQEDPQQPLFQGIDALYHFDEAHWQNPNSVINHLNSIALSFEHILAIGNKIKYKYQMMPEIMLSKIYFLFYSKILWPTAHIYTNKKDYRLVDEYHSDAKVFFDSYERLTKESVEYLIKAGRITFPLKATI